MHHILLALAIYFTIGFIVWANTYALHEVEDWAAMALARRRLDPEVHAVNPIFAMKMLAWATLFFWPVALYSELKSWLVFNKEDVTNDYLWNLAILESRLSPRFRRKTQRFVDRVKKRFEKRGLPVPELPKI